MIDTWGQAILRACWQGGLALLAAWIICAWIRRISPGIKCWVWRLGYLKFLTAFLLIGSIGLPLLPSKPVAVSSQTVVKEEMKPALTPVAERRAVAAPLAERTRAQAPAGVSARGISPVEAAVQPQESVRTVELEKTPDKSLEQTVLAPESQPMSIRALVLTAVFALWLMGVVIGIVRAMGLWRRTVVICREASEVENRDALEILKGLSARLGLGGAPRLLVSTGVSGPMLVGIIRPAILLPPGLLEEGHRESLRLLRLALTHELAHVRRKDLFWNLAQAFVETLFFFHPLVWVARRQTRYLQELACDGMTLESTQATPADYGRAILGIIERQRMEPARLAGVGVAESMNTLKKRLVAMTALRPTTGRGMILAVVMVLLLGIVGIPSWRLTERSARAAAPALQPPARVDALAEETLTVKVVDAEGKAIEGASLNLRMTGKPSVRSTTSKEGLTIFNMEDAGTGFLVEAKALGKTPAAWSWNWPDSLTQAPNRVTIRMEEATQIGGIVVDEAGKPIAGAHVVLQVVKKYSDSGQRVDISFESTQTDGNGKWTYYGVPAECDEIRIGVWSYLHLGKDAIFAIEDFKDKAALKAGSAKLTLLKGTPIHIKVVDADGNPLSGATVAYGESGGAVNVVPSPRANGDGRVELGVLPGSFVVLTAMAPGHAPEQKQVSVEKAEQELEFELKEAKPLTGKVVDADGKPIPGVTLRIGNWRDTRPFRDVKMTTGADGAFTWIEAPNDLLYVDVARKGKNELQMLMKVGVDNRVVLDGPTTLAGTVVDAESGKPIEAFTVVKGVMEGDGHEGGNQPSDIRWERIIGNGGQGKNGAFESSHVGYEQRWKVRIEAKGYLPADSDTIPRDSKRHEFTFRLVKGKSISGEVVDADGKPVKQAKVMLLLQRSRAQVLNNRPDGREPNRTTGADGKFEFDPQNEQYGVAVFADEGYALATREEMEKSEKMVLTKWATIEGDVVVGTQPAAKSTVSIDYWDLKFADPNKAAYSSPYLLQYHQVQADENGRFVADRVMAGKVTIHRQVGIGKNRFGYAGQQVITLKAGETVKMKIGGTGRPVVGRVELPQEMQKDGFVVRVSELRVNADMPRRLQPPAEIRKASAEAQNKWEEEWKQSEEGKAYELAMEKEREKPRFYPAVVQTDGRFRADEVPAGNYELVIALGNAPASDRDAMEEKVAAYCMVNVTVPEISGGMSEEPLEIGTFKLGNWKNIKVGDVAPGFAIKTLDGKDLKLEDFRGSYVALDFWATWCKPCVEEIPELKAVWEAYGKNPKYAMIGLSLDEDVKTLEEFVKEESMGWTHAFLGAGKDLDEVSKAYGVQGIPNVWLIGPDGKVIAKGLRGGDLEAAIKRAIQP